MCGICGFIRDGEQHPEAPVWLSSMQARLRHRGPDEQGQFGPTQFSSTPPRAVALGQTRLNVLDLELGHQPIPNEDESICVIANAEIYNYRDLRKELEGGGHRFRTKGDIETIVHLYEEVGDRCFERLRGMFAIALWDGRRKELVLARDRVGKKPICYSRVNGSFAFASEIKSLLEYPGIDRELDVEALDDYLTYQYVPAPLSIFKGIRKLPPGHLLRWRDGVIEVEEYWALNPAPMSDLSENDCCERVRAIMREATELRMVADVEVGAFLSGGMDSSIVVALMSQLAGRSVKTFSIGFEESDYNELPFARMVADRYRTDHHEFVVKPSALEVLPKLAVKYGEPYADASAIPTYYLAKMTREHVKVALNGDGGDESFAGYPRYRAMKVAACLDVLPRTIRNAISAIARRLPAPFASKGIFRRGRKFLSHISYPSEERYFRYISHFLPEEKKSLYSPEMMEMFAETGAGPRAFLYDAFGRFKGEKVVNEVSLVDIVTYLPYDLLVKMDIATMANSLEARSPFLDQEMVSFAAGIPAHMKMKGVRSKHILRRAFKDMLPPEILRRPKMGFGIPVAQWFRHELNDYLRDTLLSERAMNRGYFRNESVREMIELHSLGKENYANHLWALLCFELWCQAFLDD